MSSLIEVLQTLNGSNMPIVNSVVVSRTLIGSRSTAEWVNLNDIIIYTYNSRSLD